MKVLAVALFGAGVIIAQTDPVVDAYIRGVQSGNQQVANAVACLSNPTCVAAMQGAQARKGQAKAEKERLKAEAQARKDQANTEKERLKADAQARKDQLKADRERQKTEIKLAELRLKQEQTASKGRTASKVAASDAH
jgi:Skp family chaperone for outer membrane proteins